MRRAHFFSDGANHRDGDVLLAKFPKLVNANVWEKARMTGNDSLGIAVIS